VRLALAAIAVAIVGLSAAGFVDHSQKAARLRGASVKAWKCAHRGTECGATTPAAIEAAWNSRERIYAGGLIALAVAGGALIFVRASGGRRAPSRG
jgi:hypothetical protein